MKKIFIIATIALTILVSVLLFIQEMNSLKFIFAGKIGAPPFITLTIGLLFAMLFAAMPDNKSNNK